MMFMHAATLCELIYYDVLRTDIALIELMYRVCDYYYEFYLIILIITLLILPARVSILDIQW